MRGFIAAKEVYSFNGSLHGDVNAANLKTKAFSTSYDNTGKIAIQDMQVRPKFYIVYTVNAYHLKARAAQLVISVSRTPQDTIDEVEAGGRAQEH